MSHHVGLINKHTKDQSNAPHPSLPRNKRIKKEGGESASESGDDVKPEKERETKVKEEGEKEDAKMKARGEGKQGVKGEGEVKKEEVVEMEMPVAVEPFQGTGVLERGHIFFFYRTKLSTTSPHSLDEVQRLFMILKPLPTHTHNGRIEPHTEGAAQQSRNPSIVLEEEDMHQLKDQPHKLRLINIGRKKLPERRGGVSDGEGGSGRGRGVSERFWGYVARVVGIEGGEGSKGKEKEVKEESVEEGKEEGGGEEDDEMRATLESVLGPDERVGGGASDEQLQAARPCGAGVYSIVATERRRSTKLIYRLEVPETPGPVQDEFNIHKAGSFVISVKNPSISHQAGYPSSPIEPQFPESLKKILGGYRWVSANPVDFLDVLGCEVLFIASSERDVEEYMKELVDWEKEERSKIGEKDFEIVFKQLHLPEQLHHVEALHGQWV
ncbi:hypothetical protein HK102_000762 [Quaeritorhiza haematococci]|nr:hypothetical protein HK102_000762 [Quaeritorhiza haematococci]